MKPSELKFYSLGTVAANKALNSHVIEVVPVEATPMVDGEITSDKTKDSIKSQDQTGTAYQVDLDMSKSVKATWLPQGMSNRSTSPDVRRGATVILYQFADSEDLYWNTLHDDADLRKLETVVWRFSATPNEADKATADTCYFLEISTHKKLIHLHTSQKNGEPFGFDIQLNLDIGFLKIVDTAKNYVILDSAETQITLANADGSYVDVNKKNISINAPETITVTAKNLIEKIGQSIKTNAGESITEETSKLTTKVSGTIEETSGNLNIKSGPIKIDGKGVKISKGVALS